MGAFGAGGRQAGGRDLGRTAAEDLSPSVVRAAIAEDARLTAVTIQPPPDPQLAERRVWSPAAGCRIVACVDVETIEADERPVAPGVLWQLAARRMERCVRPGDWVCMLGGSRLAVCFGNGAHRIPPSSLGRRLARAMGDHLAVGSSSAELEVAVGIGVAPAESEPASVTEAAIASIRSARHHGRGGTDRPQRFVAVARIPEGSGEHGQGRPLRTRRLGNPRLVRRVLIPLQDEGVSLAETPSEAALRGGSHFRPVGAPETAVRVLVVDPDTATSRATRLNAHMVASAIRRAGAIPTVSIASTPDQILLDHLVVEPEVVVMVLHPEPRGTRGPRPDPWEKPAQLTKRLQETGSSVVVVSFGASAMAVAACVEKGATGLLDLEQLPEELSRIAGSLPNGRWRFPEAYLGLVDLTTAERRVLDQMMRGRSAADIAASQVVSLSTVRTHIRSILKKLKVNSQLAAVALGNGSVPVEPVSVEQSTA